MNQPSNLDDLIAMSKKKGRLKSVNKDVIVDILEKSSIEPKADERPDLMGMMTTEMKLLRESNERVVRALDRLDKVEKELAELKEDNAAMHQIIRNQQRFLEGVDARERQCNAVVLGLKEDDSILGDTDEERLNTVLETIGPLENLDSRIAMKRLGEGNRRPLLVTFKSKSDRDVVITNAKKLKDIKEGDNAAALKKVYIKRDQHPTWRKEYDRLRKVVKDEKLRAENAGTEVEIKYDASRRVVTRDGLVIDSFKPVFQ